MKSGHIYILSNEAFPGFLKIGRTSKDPSVRAKELSTTGVPEPFKLEFSVFVSDAVVGEKLIHNALELRGQKLNPRREFFEISIDEAIELLNDLLSSSEVSPTRYSADQLLEESDQPDYSLNHELIEFIYSKIKLPEFDEAIDQSKAAQLEKELTAVAKKGCPKAFKLISEIYERNFKSSLKFKDCYQKYLNALKEMSYFYGLGSRECRAQRQEVGRELAEYLSILSINNWLVENDFSFAQSFLLDGDGLIYEGYIDKVSRHGFLPENMQEIAVNL